MKHWWERCVRVEKPSVGCVHFHRAWWAPWKVRSMWFQPEGRSITYPVSDEVWDRLLRAASFEEAMAVVRGSGEVAPE